MSAIDGNTTEDSINNQYYLDAVASSEEEMYLQVWDPFTQTMNEDIVVYDLIGD